MFHTNTMQKCWSNRLAIFLLLLVFCQECTAASRRSRSKRFEDEIRGFDRKRLRSTKSVADRVSEYESRKGESSRRQKHLGDIRRHGGRDNLRRTNVPRRKHSARNQMHADIKRYRSGANGFAVRRPKVIAQKEKSNIENFFKMPFDKQLSSFAKELIEKIRAQKDYRKKYNEARDVNRKYSKSKKKNISKKMRGSDMQKKIMDAQKEHKDIYEGINEVSYATKKGDHLNEAAYEQLKQLMYILNYTLDAHLSAAYYTKDMIDFLTKCLGRTHTTLAETNLAKKCCKILLEAMILKHSHNEQDDNLFLGANPKERVGKLTRAKKDRDFVIYLDSLKLIPKFERRKHY